MKFVKVKALSNALGGLNAILAKGPHLTENFKLECVQMFSMFSRDSELEFESRRALVCLIASAPGLCFGSLGTKPLLPFSLTTLRIIVDSIGQLSVADKVIVFGCFVIFHFLNRASWVC
jgi:hypothetical protein